MRWESFGNRRRETSGNEIMTSQREKDEEQESAGNGMDLWIQTSSSSEQIQSLFLSPEDCSKGTFSPCVGAHHLHHPLIALLQSTVHRLYAPNSRQITEIQTLEYKLSNLCFNKFHLKACRQASGLLSPPSTASIPPYSTPHRPRHTTI